MPCGAVKSQVRLNNPRTRSAGEVVDLSSIEITRGNQLAALVIRYLVA